MKLGNGQIITTIPKELTRMYKIDKGTLLKWSDSVCMRIFYQI